MKKRLMLCSLLLVSMTVTEIADAKGSSSSGGRSSTTSSVSRSASMNTTRASTMSRASTTSRSNMNRSSFRSSSRSLVAPQRSSYKGNVGAYHSNVSSYHNNWLMYYLITNNNHRTVAEQMNFLRKMIGYPVYTVTIKDDKGQERVFSVTKTEYDKIQRGQKVVVKDGRVMIGDEKNV